MESQWYLSADEGSLKRELTLPEVDKAKLSDSFVRQSCGNGNFQLEDYRFGEQSRVTSSFSTARFRRDLLVTLFILDSVNYLEVFCCFGLVWVLFVV